MRTDTDIASHDCVEDVHLAALPLAICDRESMSGRDSDQKADLTGGGRSARMIESVLHCGERAMPGSWSWLTLNCPLDRDQWCKSLFGKSNSQRNVGVSTQSRIFKVVALERLDYCHAGPVGCICQNA